MKPGTYSPNQWVRWDPGVEASWSLYRKERHLGHAATQDHGCSSHTWSDPDGPAQALLQEPTTQSKSFVCHLLWHSRLSLPGTTSGSFSGADIIVLSVTTCIQLSAALWEQSLKTWAVGHLGTSLWLVAVQLQLCVLTQLPLYLISVSLYISVFWSLTKTSNSQVSYGLVPPTKLRIPYLQIHISGKAWIMTLDASFGNDNKDLRCVNIMIQYKCVVAVQQLANSTYTWDTF